VTTYLLHNGPATSYLTQAKADRWRHSESKSEEGEKCEERDPKPSDLRMDRLKLAVKGREGPNPRLWKKMGMICA
jgi:hypothetical protein